MILATAKSECRKHRISVERCCVADWTPNGVVIRFEDGTKTIHVMEPTCSDDEALQWLHDHIEELKAKDDSLTFNFERTANDN